MSKTSNMYTTAQVEDAIKKGTKAAQDGFEQFSRMTRDQLQQGFPSFMSGYDEVSAASKDNLDALAKSSALMAKGSEQIFNTWMGYCQEAFENNVSAMKAIMSCKNPKEAVELQSDVAKTNMDRFLSEANKVTEMGMKAANEASQPIQKRVDQTVTAFSKKTAA